MLLCCHGSYIADQSTRYQSEIELVAGCNNDRLFMTIEHMSHRTQLYRMCDAQPVRLVHHHTTTGTSTDKAVMNATKTDDMTQWCTELYQPSVSADGATLTCWCRPLHDNNDNGAAAAAKYYSCTYDMNMITSMDINHLPIKSLRSIDSGPKLISNTILNINRLRVPPSSSQSAAISSSVTNMVASSSSSSSPTTSSNCRIVSSSSPSSLSSKQQQQQHTWPGTRRILGQQIWYHP